MKPNYNTAVLRLLSDILMQSVLCPLPCSFLKAHPSRKEGFLTIVNYVFSFMSINILAAWNRGPPVAQFFHPPCSHSETNWILQSELSQSFRVLYEINNILCSDPQSQGLEMQVNCLHQVFIFKHQSLPCPIDILRQVFTIGNEGTCPLLQKTSMIRSTLMILCSLQ